MTLGVFHQVYTRPKATEEAIKSFRQFHPDTPYVLICDGGKSFHRIAKKYDCFYVHEENNLGYKDHTHAHQVKFGNIPIGTGIYGMTKEKVLEWLRRFRLACTLCNTDHILMMEDDILIRGEINVPETWEFAGQAKPGNLLQEEFMRYLTEKYGVEWNVNYYGTGGGSIFNANTFLENYERVIKIFDEEFDYIKNNLCGNLGWVDVWMHMYYFLCGKQYRHNNLLTETTSNPIWDISKEPIVHQYKVHYE